MSAGWQAAAGAAKQTICCGTPRAPGCVLGPRISRLRKPQRDNSAACSSATAESLPADCAATSANKQLLSGGGHIAGSPVDEVSRWWCDTYRITYRGRVQAKVESAAAALLAVEPACGGIDLRRDVLPKVELLEALSPGLGWKVFSRYPAEFIHPYAVDYWRIMAALLYTTGFSPERVSALFRRHACLFARTVQDPGNLKALFDWLRGLGLGQAEVARVINKHPLILQADVGGTLKPRLDFMEGLGLTPEAAVAVVRRHPELLSIDSAVLQERVDFFAHLGLSSAEIARLFSSQAPVFACSVEGKLRPLVELLREELGCEGALLRRMVARSGLSSRAPATIRSRVATWRELGVGPDPLLAALRRFPRLLLYPVDEPKYQRKVQFLLEELQLTPAALAVFPQYMSYSLPRRIAPRVAAARRFAGATPRLQALALKDEAFCKAHGIAAEEFATFLDEWPGTEEGQRWAEG